LDIKLRVSSIYPEFTKSERKVAEHLLHHAEEAIYYSVTEFADVAGVGETTVMRFCRKIGFKGYHDFRLALAQDISARKPVPETKESGNFVHLVFREAVNVLQDSMSLLDQNALDRAIELVDRANHLQFFGVGSSAITAHEAKIRLMRLGRRADAITDTHFQAMAAVSLGEGDVAFGISLSGSTLDTVDVLKKAKQSGASVIAMTNYARSPITAIADVVLLTAGKESPLQGGSNGGRISQLFLLELLCEGLARKNEARAEAMRERTARAVIDRIY